MIAVTDWSDDVAVLPMSVKKENCGSHAAGESTTTKSRNKPSAWDSQHDLPDEGVFHPGPFHAPDINWPGLP